MKLRLNLPGGAVETVGGQKGAPVGDGDRRQDAEYAYDYEYFYQGKTAGMPGKTAFPPFRHEGKITPFNCPCQPTAGWRQIR